MNAQTLTTASRLALALLFLAAAPLKILFPADFAEAIATYLILPDALVNFTALTLPWLEAVVAILLLCRVWSGPTLFLANAMLVAFLGALVSAHLRGINIDCGCFSAAGTATSDMLWYIARDGLFLALGLAAALLHRFAPEYD
jgi:hypothetical protein